MTPAEQFFAKVDTSGECWMWTGAKQFRVGTEKVHPRRFSYELHRGPSGDIALDMSCGERWCVNPDHIVEHEPVQHEHGNYLRYMYGCRCRECRDANTNQHKVNRAARTSRPKDPTDPRHGTASFYRNHGCRCEPCRSAHYVVVTAEQKRRMNSPIDPNDPRHGRASFYVAYGCRCERCKKASSDYQKAQRERKAS